jgi:hypothetical protein
MLRTTVIHTTHIGCHLKEINEGTCAIRALTVVPSGD